MATALLESNTAVRMVNGRLVSLSLSDPSVQKTLEIQRKEREKNLETLRASYVARGILSRSGQKLSTKYGG